jgi:hypothetical protein
MVETTSFEARDQKFLSLLADKFKENLQHLHFVPQASLESSEANQERYALKCTLVLLDCSVYQPGYESSWATLSIDIVHNGSVIHSLASKQVKGLGGACDPAKQAAVLNSYESIEPVILENMEKIRE